MEIKHVKVGPLRTNTYCLFSANEAVIIDPGGDPEKIISCIDNKEVVAIIATHGHFDHVLAVSFLKKKFSAPFYIHKADIEIMRLSLEHFGGEFVYPDRLLDEGDTIIFGDSRLLVLHTPGHTPGSICLYDPQRTTIFTGDTLFRGYIGRTDFLGGDPNKIFDSLKKIFSLMPDNAVVYPGHGKPTTIGTERKNLKHLINY